MVHDNFTYSGYHTVALWEINKIYLHDGNINTITHVNTESATANILL